MKGYECCGSDNSEECPICFLGYSEVNTTKCCNANICTECYLQVRPQKEKQSTCPFCSSDNLSVVVAKKNKNKNDLDSIIPGGSSSSSSTVSLSANTSASIASTISGTCSNSKHKGSSPIVMPSGNGKKKSTASVAPHTTCTGFGSSLEKDERFKMTRKRSESFASNEGSHMPQKENEIIKSIAMTTEERECLEDEMRAQHLHPLVLELEAEAQERRLENDRAYRSSTGRRNSARTQQTADLFRNHSIGEDVGSGINNRRMRLRGGDSESTRNWDQLANFFERGDAANSIDDMSALEAAILFSLGEDRLTSSSSSSNDGENNNNNNNNNNNSNNNSGEPQRNSSREGFPLLRSLLTGQMDGTSSGSSTNGREEEDSTAPASGNLNSSRRGRVQLMRSSLGALSAARQRGMGSVTLDTASLMMRGLSEDDQISMAIAASLQDQSANDSNEASGDDHYHEEGEEEEEEERANSSSENIADVVSAEVQHDSVEASSSSLSSSSSSSSIALVVPKQQESIVSDGSGYEESTIIELARVVTDSAATTNAKVSLDDTASNESILVA